MLEEAMESPGFWILGCVGSAMVIIGWIWSKKMDWVTMPIWQVAVMVLICWGAAIFFSQPS